MCCFSGPVHVEGTQIFARSDARGWQCVVYEMKYSSKAPVAMVLPLPYAPAIGDENGGEPLRFVNLSEYSGFFKSLDNGFERTGVLSKGDDDDASYTAAGPPRLRVERVGDFVASFVPSVKDFARLDARFRMKDDVWRSLPQYRDYGFAVFQLAAKNDGHVHPMAFVFRSRDPSRIFFPTVHIHDGTVPQRARFDHMLYVQATRPPQDWVASMYREAKDFVDIERAERLVRSTATMYRTAMHGLHENEDIWVNA